MGLGMVRVGTKCLVVSQCGAEQWLPHLRVCRTWCIRWVIQWGLTSPAPLIQVHGVLWSSAGNTQPMTWCLHAVHWLYDSPPISCQSDVLCPSWGGDVKADVFLPYKPTSTTVDW